jgi:hypothetical protein
MNDHFSPISQDTDSSGRTRSFARKSLGRGIGLLIVLALGSGAFLLCTDLFWSPGAPFGHAPVSAAPLLLIGLAACVFQFFTRPKPLDLFKALIVSAAFLFWGVDQLLPPGWFATTLGDLVIVLYVIDLGWMMAERLNLPTRQEQLSSLLADPEETDVADSLRSPGHPDILFSLKQEEAHS